jgi:predicted enzyme related to lactoylglutathione lyase
MQSSSVSATLFAKDLEKVAAFYAGALNLERTFSDAHHWVLSCRGFELVVHQIPKHVADGIIIRQPPERRASGSVRLNFPVHSIADSRRIAQSLGGQIDDTPPQSAGPNADFFLGYDPEGNVFKVSQVPR